VDDGQGHPAETADRVTEEVPAARPLAALEGQVSRHPYATVAAALGIGYALGGGIFTPLTGRLVRLGVRIGIRTALLPILKAEVSELAAAFIGDVGDENEQGEPT
jgi:hypothetical protein